MAQSDFARLHTQGDPLILYNIWDAGSAEAVEKAGAKALATGSASVAGAMGYEDGEGVPFEAMLTCVRQIVSVAKVPLSVDFETGFAPSLDGLEANARALVEAGAVGCNLEDRLLESSGSEGEALRPITDQAQRVTVAAQAGLFVNARTDTFLAPLMKGDNPNRSELVDAALERASAYAQAGAGSFFVPGLTDPALLARMCEESPLPVNAMRLPDMVSNAELAKLGVARISYGPGPWRSAMAQVEKAAREALGTN